MTDQPAWPSRSSSLLQDVPGSVPIKSPPPEDDGTEQEATTSFHSLSQAVHARRAEYVRPKHVRIKIGTWNVAAYKGAEKDLGAWFVRGQGVTEALAGLHVTDQADLHRQHVPEQSDAHEREDVAQQEARFQRDRPTVPEGDPGSVLPAGEDVGLYVLGLQEVVDVNSATEALRPYTDPSAAKRWRDAMQAALPRGYVLVAEQQLIGLLLFIYASADVAGEITSVSTTSVGTGLMGYMGNKGAVTARIVLGDTTRLVFVDSHLASGAEKASLERRNWDAGQIVQRTRFEPIQDAMDLSQTTGEQLGDEDFAFWFGDLNYRLEGIPGDDVRRLLMLHTRNEYDLSQSSSDKINTEIALATESVKTRAGRSSSESSASFSSVETSRASSDDTRPSTDTTEPHTLVDEVAETDDPTSLQTCLDSLLPHDQLHQQMKARKAFHDGWREGPIAFLPTYKYDVGRVGVFDSSEKKRAPSWCDRILYRTRRDKLAYDAKIKEEEQAKKKDEEMKASGTDQAAADEEILYDYDPDTDGENLPDDGGEHDEYDATQDGMVITKEGFEDEISLEYYTAHQRVLSSDHKPLNAIFQLKYDAVVPELKAKIHAVVAKDLDKAENECRPNVTVAVDQHNDSQVEQSEDSSRDFEGVWFGSVRWGQAKHRSLTIANTSRVPASFTLIERPVDRGQSAGIAPSWLKLTMEGTELASSASATVPATIEPGETLSLDLALRVFDMNVVQALNGGIQGLDDVLVLRVEGGRDHFIPVRAKWLDTSLGRSIDRLVRIPEGGIRKLQKQLPDASTSKSGSAGSGRDSTVDEPVRFSAPRELFRLTEAVEKLSTRVVAEWDMTSPSDDLAHAPWNEHPGWPFDEQCWTERSTSHWEAALSEACNALDTDAQLETSIPDLPLMQRLYVLSSLLLLFLQNMPDGTVPEDLWGKLDTFCAENEKPKQKPKLEEQRTAIEEILSQSTPGHHISFVLITTMLDRIIQEVSGSSSGSSARDESVPSSPTSPFRNTMRPVGALKRVATLGKLPAEPTKDRASAALAKRFANAIIRSPAGGEKARATREKRKAEIVEAFLRRDEPG